MGDFDAGFSSAVRILKQKYPAVKLVLIKPYFSNELNTNQTYYLNAYDEIILPFVLSGVHPKSAITKRNRWMVENCDFIVSCVYKNHGGAYTAVKYAALLNKKVISVLDL